MQSISMGANQRILGPIVTLSASLLGCAGPGGEVSVLVEPEVTILEGIPAGSRADEVQDGWSVSFERYVVALGPVELRPLDGGEAAADPARWLVDLVAIPAEGEALWQLDGLAEGRWDIYFGTETSGYGRHDSVAEDDFEQMVEGELSHLIRGTLANSSGTSCPPRDLADVPEDADVVGQNSAEDDCFSAPSIAFTIEARAAVTYGPCSIDGLPGVSVSSSDPAAVAISVHGDHIFFGGFPEGSEGEVRRYAQWLADCDLNLDGVVTSDELERIPPSALAEFDERFPLGGSPVRPIENLLTYVESQLSTQGHFQGEGECSLGFEPL